MSGLLTTVFGESGNIASAMSGIWWLVGIFVFLFFIIYLYSRKAGAENIVLFTLLFIALTLEFSLFEVPFAITITVIVLLILYTAQYLYYWINR